MIDSSPSLFKSMASTSSLGKLALVSNFSCWVFFPPWKQLHITSKNKAHESCESEPKQQAKRR